MSDYEQLADYAKPHPKDFRESIYYQRGLAGELVVAHFLQKKGWAVFHAAGVNGEGAPLLRSDRRRSDPVPDLDVSRDGARLWVEVKTKTKAVLQRSRGQYRHGIERRKLEAYWRVQETTGTPCYLVFYELLSTLFLCQSLDVLVPMAQAGGGGDHYTEQMVFWDRTPESGVFKIIGSTDPPDRIPGTEEWHERICEDRVTKIQPARNAAREERSHSRHDPKALFQR